MPNWTAVVLRYARAAGIELSPQTIDELATHLEDLYLAARDRGANEHAAREEARQALETSGLLPLRREPRPDPRAAHARTANDIAITSRSRGLSMLYALRMALRQFRQHPAFALVTVLVLGLDATPFEISAQVLVRRQLVLRGSLTYDHPADFRSTVARVQDGQISPGRVISEEYPLEDVQRAFESSGSAGGKTWIRVASTLP